MHILKCTCIILAFTLFFMVTLISEKLLLPLATLSLSLSSTERARDRARERERGDRAATVNEILNCLLWQIDSCLLCLTPCHVTLCVAAAEAPILH